MQCAFVNFHSTHSFATPISCAVSNLDLCMQHTENRNKKQFFLFWKRPISSCFSSFVHMFLFFLSLSLLHISCNVFKSLALHSADSKDFLFINLVFFNCRDDGPNIVLITEKHFSGTLDFGRWRAFQIAFDMKCSARKSMPWIDSAP